jgi:hypothetical protein
MAKKLDVFDEEPSVKDKSYLLRMRERIADEKDELKLEILATKLRFKYKGVQALVKDEQEKLDAYVKAHYPKLKERKSQMVVLSIALREANKKLADSRKVGDVPDDSVDELDDSILKDLL